MPNALHQNDAGLLADRILINVAGRQNNTLPLSKMTENRIQQKVNKTPTVMHDISNQACN